MKNRAKLNHYNGLLQNGCSEKLIKTRKKTTEVESFLSIVADFGLALPKNGSIVVNFL